MVSSQLPSSASGWSDWFDSNYEDDMPKRKVNEEFNHSLLHLRSGIQLKKRKTGKRESIIYNARTRYCQYNELMSPCFKDVSILDNDTSKLLITKKTKNYGQLRKNLPNEEYSLDKLSTELDLSILLTDKNYFPCLIDITTYFRKLASIYLYDVFYSGAVPYLIKFLDIKTILKYVNLNKNDYDLLEKLNIPTHEQTVESKIEINNSFVYHHSDLKPTVTKSQIYHLQLESLLCLTQIMSEFDTRISIVYEATPYFIELLKCENSDIFQQAIWTLGIIIEECVEFRDHMLFFGAMKVLVNNAWPLASYSLISTRSFAWVLSHCFKFANWEFVKDGYPTLCDLLFHDDEQIQTDVCWAFSCVTQIPGTISVVVETKGILERILHLCEYSSNTTITDSALAIISDITLMGTEHEIKALLDLGVLKVLQNTLFHTAENTKKGSVWIISNLTGGSQNQIKEVIDSGVLGTIVDYLNTQDFEIAKECTCVISNVLNGGSKDDIKRIVKTYDNVIEALVRFLEVKDKEVLGMLLSGIEAILKVFNIDKIDVEYNLLIEKMFHHGVDTKIQNLLWHEDEEIVKKAISIDLFL
ncbi:hypothetical protein ABK040_011638 [Willaertia magna]